MRLLRDLCALLLALPLLGSTVNHFVGFARPSADGALGLEILDSLREGGLMLWVAIGHGLIGVLLLLPRCRFLAGLVQFPVSLGILAFNVTLYPPGVPLAIAMFALNVGLILDAERLHALVPPPAAAA